VKVTIRDHGKVTVRRLRRRGLTARAAGLWAPADAYYDCYPSFTGGILGGGNNQHRDRLRTQLAFR
jgi:hypothetical protein